MHAPDTLSKTENEELHGGGLFYAGICLLAFLEPFSVCLRQAEQSKNPSQTSIAIPRSLFPNNALTDHRSVY